MSFGTESTGSGAAPETPVPAVRESPELEVISLTLLVWRIGPGVHTRRASDVPKHDGKYVRVSKTQAVTAKCRNFYNMAAFPFDHQELHTSLFVLPE